jgi:FrmR/RcnR family transcriptional regulator, repressor of frmRAB operon
MAHTIRDKNKLLNRVRRIRGQIDAVAKALEEERDCSAILLNIAACRGAINGLMAEIIEGHIPHHVVDPDKQPSTERAKAGQDLTANRNIATERSRLEPPRVYSDAPTLTS